MSVRGELYVTDGNPQVFELEAGFEMEVVAEADILMRKFNGHHRCDDITGYPHTVVYGDGDGIVGVLNMYEQ